MTAYDVYNTERGPKLAKKRIYVTDLKYNLFLNSVKTYIQSGRDFSFAIIDLAENIKKFEQKG